MTTGVLDHLVFAASTLEAGVAHVESVLGLTLAPGGAHAAMGTHNRLLSLGPEAYLEVIAVDPEGENPGHPRWFDLDNFEGPPRLIGWAVRVKNPNVLLNHEPEKLCRVIAFSRGEYRWQMAVPYDGRWPYNGLYPARIAWESAMPAPSLPDFGARLISFTLAHPETGPLAWALGGAVDDDRVLARKGAKPEMRAVIHTENGEEVLT